MLTKIDNKGHAWPVKEVPYSEEYKSRLSRLNPGEFDEVWRFLKSELDAETGKFSVGTKYPNTNRVAWDGPLSYLWESTGRDAEQAGYLLGIIMMDLIIQDADQWLCVKTNVTKRAFDTEFYFRPNK